jgi:putative membrane-bound dehydrogenase-like protein
MKLFAFVILFNLLSWALPPPLKSAEFPAPFNTERSTNAPLNPAQAASQMQLPPGFRCSVFAAEPDVHQPISMATDPRGRLWVAENYTYSERTVGYHPELRDRIVVFDDSDNDGRFNKRTVFWDGAERLTSIEVGLGGVWAICLPNLVFIPDENGDDVPDGPPRILLDGFEYRNARHTVANGLRWGPDGWLYGRQGIMAASLVGAPGTPKEQRTSMNVGIWRYHPTRKVFEIVAQGTTNPWGMDWDARGEAFFINTVIGHLWHVIPGAHYRRMYGDDPTPRVYELLEQHADHVHWATGEVWTDVRKGVTGSTLEAGGGHAHTGLLIYQGGQWPPEWNGKLLTINFHGRRLNVERLERAGSGYVGRREPDAFLFPDPWFRGIDLIAAPDGGVFVSDWSDAGECHDEEGIHRTSGRIYKLTHGDASKSKPADLAKLSDQELVALQTSPNDWLARQSRGVLAARARGGSGSEKIVDALGRLAMSGTNEIVRLRALWALHIIGGDNTPLLHRRLTGTEHERAWAIRLLEDISHRSPIVRAQFLNLLDSKLALMSGNDPSALVRLTLASLLQRLPLTNRPALAAGLLSHPEDADDHNLSLMIWYGIEPLAHHDERFVGLIASAHIPRVQRLGARRLAEEIDTAPKSVDELLSAIAANPAASARQAVLDGIAEGLTGRRKVKQPGSWEIVRAKFSEDATEPLRVRLRDLSALFGDGRALDAVRAVALNDGSDLPQRRAALQSLIEARAPGLREVCERLLPVRDLSATAASGLALFDDAALADRLLAEWPKLYGHERPAVLNALVSRPTWAARLLEAMAAAKFKRNDLGVLQARQIRAFNEPALTRRLTAVWGEIRDPNEAEKNRLLAKWKQNLTPDALAKSDLRQGHQTFQTVCAPCHQLHGEGGALGPDLTGGNRDNLDYLLENLLFPSAIVPAEYRQTTLTLKDGRVLTGVIRTRAARTITLQAVGELVTVEIPEVESEETSAQSLMPEGLLDALDETQSRNLIRFLMTKDPPPRQK